MSFFDFARIANRLFFCKKQYRGKSMPVFLSCQTWGASAVKNMCPMTTTHYLSWTCTMGHELSEQKMFAFFMGVVPEASAWAAIVFHSRCFCLDGTFFRTTQLASLIGPVAWIPKHQEELTTKLNEHVVSNAAHSNSGTCTEFSLIDWICIVCFAWLQQKNISQNLNVLSLIVTAGTQHVG